LAELTQPHPAQDDRGVRSAGVGGDLSDLRAGLRGVRCGRSPAGLVPAGRLADQYRLTELGAHLFAGSAEELRRERRRERAPEAGGDSHGERVGLGLPAHDALPGLPVRIAHTICIAWGSVNPAAMNSSYASWSCAAL